MAVITKRATPQGHEVIEHRPHKRLLWPHAPNVTLAALRIIAGLLFAVHGAQKLFGFLNPEFAGAPALLSQMWFAGVLEFFGGIMVAMGLFTRLVAFFLAGEMAVAYFMAHAPQGFWPIQNRGETAVLYCFIFLAFAGMGAGRFSVDEVIANARRPRASSL
jgi:putative oxidoreductase